MALYQHFFFFLFHRRLVFLCPLELTDFPSEDGWSDRAQPTEYLPKQIIASGARKTKSLDFYSLSTHQTSFCECIWPSQSMQSWGTENSIPSMENGKFGGLLRLWWFHTFQVNVLSFFLSPFYFQAHDNLWKSFHAPLTKCAKWFMTRNICILFYEIVAFLIQ